MPAKISYLLLVLGLFTASTVFSQNIRKVKIEELGSYIQKSERPLVVNFWATWCAPCVAELPYFQEEVKKQASNNVELVLVSLDFADAYPAKLSAFIKKNKYEASFFWLDETNADHFCPVIDKSWSGSIPSTLFINNKTGYRKFFERQLTHPQLILAMQELVK